MKVVESHDHQVDGASLASRLEADMTDRYGPLLRGAQLVNILGYPSVDAFRQALVRESVPVPVFSIEGRRGKFALTSEVAAWLARARLSTSQKGSTENATGGDP